MCVKFVLRCKSNVKYTIILSVGSWFLESNFAVDVLFYFNHCEDGTNNFNEVYVASKHLQFLLLKFHLAMKRN